MWWLPPNWQAELVLQAGIWKELELCAWLETGVKLFFPVGNIFEASALGPNR